MNQFALFLFIALFIVTFLQCAHHSHQQQQQQLPLSRQYQYNTTLSSDGNFDLFWSIVDGDLYMAMSAQTNGWLAVGFNSFMENDETLVREVDMRLTDMIIGWRDSSGNTYLYDSYAMSSNSIPSMDTRLGGVDNAVLIQSWEQTGRTIIEFKRPLDTTDSYDLTILPNKKLILLYALSAQDPNNNQYNSLSIHTHRGVVAIPNFWPQALSNNNTTNTNNNGTTVLSEKQSSLNNTGSSSTTSTSTTTTNMSSSSSNISNQSSSSTTSTTTTTTTTTNNNNDNNGSNNNTSSGQIGVVPVPQFPPQTSIQNNTSTNTPQSPNNENNNQTVIPPIFPTNSSQSGVGNSTVGIVTTPPTSSSSKRPGKEKPSVLTSTTTTNRKYCGPRCSILIVLVNLLMVQIVLAVL